MNEIKELAYLSSCASDSICTDTCTDTCIGTTLNDNDEIEGRNAIWSAIGEFSPTRATVKTSLLLKNRIYDAEGSFFKVLIHRKAQKPILFGTFKTDVKVLEPSENEESLNFYKPNSKKNMGYNFKKKLSLNFGKRVRTKPFPSARKGKPIDYYHKTKRGLGYVSDPLISASRSDESIYHNHSSNTLSWDSNNVGEIFRGLLINMVSVSHLEDDEDDGLLQSDQTP